MRVEDFPNVWGEGQLLAFSGVDGGTSWFEPFVLHTAAEPGNLRLKLPVDLPVVFTGLGNLDFTCVTGDAIVADTYRAAFADHRTLIGTLPTGAVMRVGETEIDPRCTIWSDDDDYLMAGCQDGCWFIARRRTGEPLVLTATVADVVKARLAYLRDLPLPPALDGAARRLLRKAISVAKVNVEAPSGCIPRRWSTPDRWPHRHMWLWDSAFHAVGMSHYNLPLAQDILLAMLERVADSGQLPHMTHPGGAASAVTQPPLLAWATLSLLERGADLQWAEQCRPYLHTYLEWDRLNRDRNGNGIPEWYIEGQPLCRCGESGLDNSPVYDGAILLDAPDFGAFLAHDYACLATIAERTGDPGLAARAQEVAGRIGDKVRDLLWWPERELFFHRDFDGNFVDSEAISGFMPLFAGVATAEQAAALVRHLENPATFGAPVPVPTMSLRSGTYSKDMWRGPSWMNLNYLIYLGLRRYNYHDQAARLRARMLETIGHWYEETGCIWEYYDSLGHTAPGRLDRKQRLISGSGIGPISDYHWTAAVTAALLFDAH